MASTAARNRRIRKARLRSQARRRLARAAHRARSGGNAGAGERAWADSATVERREADVPVARDGHARKRECRALTSATTAVTPPGVPPAPHFRAGAAADAKDLGASPPKRRHMQRRMRWRQRNATRRPGREKCAAGTRCAARRRPRSGLFDIVKNDDGRAGSTPAWALQLCARALMPVSSAGRPVVPLSASGLRQHAQRQEMPPDPFHVLDETRVAAGVRAARPRQIVGHDIGDAAGS